MGDWRVAKCNRGAIDQCQHGAAVQSRHADGDKWYRLDFTGTNPAVALPEPVGVVGMALLGRPGLYPRTKGADLRRPECHCRCRVKRSGYRVGVPAAGETGFE